MFLGSGMISSESVDPINYANMCRQQTIQPSQPQLHAVCLQFEGARVARGGHRRPGVRLPRECRQKGKRCHNLLTELHIVAGRCQANAQVLLHAVRKIS